MMHDEAVDKTPYNGNVRCFGRRSKQADTEKALRGTLRVILLPLSAKKELA